MGKKSLEIVFFRSLKPRQLNEHGKKKKELRSVGPPAASAYFLFYEVYNKQVGEAGFEPT